MHPMKPIQGEAFFNSASHTEWIRMRFLGLVNALSSSLFFNFE